MLGSKRSLAALLASGLIALGLSAPGWAQDAAVLRKKVQEAFSPVGRWTIMRMSVEQVTAQSGGGAQAKMEIKSHLGPYGWLEVQPNGDIHGEGRAIYTFIVEAGANMPTPAPVSIPIKGKATGTGERSFTVTGSCNFDERTITLEPFEPEDNPLPVTIAGPIPANADNEIEIPLWPPMVRVVSKYQVAGASLVMRASGTVQDRFKVRFEAVKDVDLQSLFLLLVEQLATEGAR